MLFCSCLHFPKLTQKQHIWKMTTVNCHINDNTKQHALVFLGASDVIMSLIGCPQGLQACYHCEDQGAFCPASLHFEYFWEQMVIVQMVHISEQDD